MLLASDLAVSTLSQLDIFEGLQTIAGLADVPINLRDSFLNRDSQIVIRLLSEHLLVDLVTVAEHQRVELGSQRRNVFNRHFDALAVLLEVGGVPSVGIV